MCNAPKIEAPAPAPAAPPTLDQLAPKSAKPDAAASKRKGLSRYKIDNTAPSSKTNKLGGIPKKTGV